MDRPNHFLFQVGGFGDRQTLEMSEDGEIIIKPGQAGIAWFYEGEAQLKPDPGKWAAFMAKIDELRVWDWEASYYQLDMCDGTQWELELTMGDKNVKSYGSNKRPQSFDQFKDALAELLS